MPRIATGLALSSWILLGWLASASFAAAPAEPVANSPAKLDPQATPRELRGRWYALSTTAMAITGDIEFLNGRLRTTKTFIDIKPRPVVLEGFDGKAWIAPLGAASYKLLSDSNRFCSNPGQPDPVHWVVIRYRVVTNLDGTLDDKIELDSYRTEAPPTRVHEADPGYCGGMSYLRLPHGRALTPAIR